MDTNENEKRPSGWSKDTVFVRVVDKGLPVDSPEFQARANRPLSERGPNLARYREEQKAADDQPPTA